MKKTFWFLTIIFSGALTNIILAQSEGDDRIELPWYDPDVLYNFPENTTTVNSFGNGSSLNQTATITATDLTDIHVFPDGDPQTEPHMSINKNHPNIIMISANCVDHTLSLGCQSTQSIYINNNYNLSAASWQHFKEFPNASTACVVPYLGLGGDPSTAFDADGYAYVTTMIDKSSYNFILNKSTDLGVSWGNSYTDGNASTYPQRFFDKEMIAIDNYPNSPVGKKNNIYCAWTQEIGFTNPRVHAIKFNRSINNGNSFLPPIELFPITGSGSALGTNIQTGINGEVYVCWTTYPDDMDDISIDLNRKISFTSSSDGGQSFIPFSHISINGNIGFTGIQNTSAQVAEFGNTRITDMPSMAVDRSCSPYRGRIYIAYNFNTGPSPIVSRIAVIYSDDQGGTWNFCNTTGIVDVNHLQNWMPWIAVDQASGIVCVAYLTIEDAAFHTKVYMAYSDDGGATFSNIQVSDAGISPTRQPAGINGYCGDYIAVDAYGGNAYVAWNDNRNGAWNIYCSTVQFACASTVSSDVDLNPTVPLDFTNTQGSFNYLASNSITVTLNNDPFSIPGGATVTFQAGNFIHFNPGFSTLAGSTTHAFILPPPICTTPYRMAELPGASTPGLNGSDQMELYPVPFQSGFSVNYFAVTDENINIDMFDAYGKKVFNLVRGKAALDGKYSVQVNPSLLAPGVYYIVLSSKIKNIVKRTVKL